MPAAAAPQGGSIGALLCLACASQIKLAVLGQGHGVPQQCSAPLACRIAGWGGAAGRQPHERLVVAGRGGAGVLLCLLCPCLIKPAVLGQAVRCPRSALHRWAAALRVLG